MKTAWVMLLVAGLFEILMALGLKYTEGFTRLAPSTGTIFASVLSFYFLSRALRFLPIGTAYAVWTGIGAAGTAVLGIMVFGDSCHPIRLVCIGLIVIGVLGLKLAS